MEFRTAKHLIFTVRKLAANCLYFLCLLPFIILSSTHCPLTFKRTNHHPLALLRAIKPRQLAVPQTVSLFLPPSSAGVPQSQHVSEHERVTPDRFDVVYQSVGQETGVMKILAQKVFQCKMFIRWRQAHGRLESPLVRSNRSLKVFTF